MMQLNMQFFGGRGAASNAWRAMQGTPKGKPNPIDISKIKNQKLSAVENSIRGKQHEEAYVYDENGNLVAGFRGGKGSVSIDSSKIPDNGVVTHNHPTGQADFGATFSFADVEHLANKNYKEMRAVSSGQGEYNYIMRKGANANSKGFVNQIAKDKPKIERDFKSSYKTEYDKAIKAGKTTKQASHQARQVGTGVIAKYWADTAPQFGFEYIRRKKSYDY